MYHTGHSQQDNATDHYYLAYASMIGSQVWHNVDQTDDDSTAESVRAYG